MQAVQPELSTKQLLLLTAERLFAETGIEAVTLRQISLEAGQGNSSSAHYHFGTRTQLLEALLAYRVSAISELRAQEVEALRAAPTVPELRALLGALIHPYVLYMKTQGRDCHYLRFLVNYLGSNRDKVVDIFGAADPRGDTRFVVGKIFEVLKSVPRELLMWRMEMMAHAAIFALAGNEGALHSDRLSWRQFQRAAEDLVDMMAGALSAKVN